MVVVFPHFSLFTQLRAFWIQHQKLSLDMWFKSLQTQNWFSREIKNRTDSKISDQFCNPNTGFSGGARLNILMWLDSPDA